MMVRYGLVAWSLALAFAGCADTLGMKLSTHQKQDTGTTESPVDAGGSTTVPEVVPHSIQNGAMTIAWMSNGTTSSFFNTSRNGATAAGQAVSTKDLQVNVTIMDPPSNVATTQAQRIRDAVADTKVMGLAIDVIDPAIINPEIDRAVEAGITVMTFDSDAPGSKRLSYYSMDNLASGAAAAKILTGMMGAGGDIAIMHKENPPTAENFRQRRDGFLNELAKYPGFKVVVELPCTDGATGESTLKAGCAGVLEETMVSHPTVTGWFLSRGRPLRQADLGKDAPNWTAKVKSGAFFAVTYDATPEAIPNIKAGYVNATINQKYYGWGFDVVTLLFNVIVNKRSVNVFTDSGFDVVCANNVEEVSQAWNLSSFTKPISKCLLNGKQWP